MQKSKFFRLLFLIRCNLSKSAQFRTRHTSPPAHCTATIYQARLVWYLVQTGAACPASGRVCRCAAWFALHLVRPVLLSVLCSPSGCAGGWGLHLWGIWREPGVGWSTPRIEKIQKRRFSAFPLHTHPTFTNPNPSDCASLQKFRKKQKDPSRSLDCGIIS